MNERVNGNLCMAHKKIPPPKLMHVHSARCTQRCSRKLIIQKHLHDTTRRNSPEKRRIKRFSWYFEPSQPQRTTSRLKTMFNLSPIYSERKPSNHKLSENHKISPDTKLHKTKHTQTSNKFFSKN